MSHTFSFVCGCVLTLVVCAAVAGYVWMRLTDAWDHKPTKEELKEKVGEVWK